MMLLNSYLYDTHERADIARLKRVYTLYCGGLFKTCRYDQALILLKTGKWFDKTNYLPNEEVLNYERPEELGRQRICSNQSEASMQRHQPKHQQHQPNLSHNWAGKEDAREGNGTRSTNGEVRKRGRPKVIK
jgi:hypothetical protein